MPCLRLLDMHLKMEHIDDEKGSHPENNVNNFPSRHHLIYANLSMMIAAFKLPSVFLVTCKIILYILGKHPESILNESLP